MRQLPVEAAGLTVRLVERSDSRKLIEGFERRLAASENVTVYLMANALGVETNSRGDKVVAVPVGTLEGKRFRVQPKLTVLAAGGIENPRLLLESGLDSANEGGPLVGAFFMDHPYMEIGPLRDAARQAPNDFTVDGRRERTVLVPHGVITMGETILRDEQLVNGAAYFRVGPSFRHATSYNSEGMMAARELTRHFRRGEIPPRFGELALIAARGAHQVADSALRAAAGRARPRDDVGVRLMMESSPERTSRISLSNKKGPLGLRLVSVDWRTSPSDARSANRFVDLLTDLLAGEGFGRLPRQSNGLWPGRIHPGNHHTGTTRMHVDPQQGVVDENARMHSVGNLYIAGSSVFPTSGTANPTLTIVALAIRLSDHIRAAL
jgi:choline dehydrogenase-like flavoprotein